MIGGSDAFVSSFSGAVLQQPSARLDSKVMQPPIHDTDVPIVDGLRLRGLAFVGIHSTCTCARALS